MNKLQTLRSHANRLEEIAQEIDSLIEEAADVISEAEEAGDDTCLDISSEFENYIKPHFKIYALGKEDSGYMSHNKGLKDLAEDVREAYRELKEIEANES